MSWVNWGVELGLERGLHRRSPGSAPPFTTDWVQRILVVRNDNIGDLLCTTPALRALRRAFPGAYLAVLAPEHCRSVMERNPDVDDLFAYTKAKHAPGWMGLPALWDLTWVIRNLRAGRFDLAISLRRSFSRSSAWLAYASGAPWRLGYPAPDSHPFRFFLNLGQDARLTSYHEVDGCLDLLGSIGIPAAGRALTLIPDPDAKTGVRLRLGEAGVVEGGGMALVHISNRREASRWPLSAFAQATDLLHERLGLSIVLSWAPGDETNPLFPGDDGKAEEVAARMRARPTLLRTPDLKDLIAAVSLSDLVLSTDGGLMHIAAALDVPQVVLFGRTDPRYWGPVSEKSVVLRKGGRADRIPVEEVVDAAVAMMSRWGRGAATSPQSAARPSGV
jgi:heptosyltransferase-3